MTDDRCDFIIQYERLRGGLGSSFCYLPMGHVGKHRAYAGRRGTMTADNPECEVAGCHAPSVDGKLCEPHFMQRLP